MIKYQGYVYYKDVSIYHHVVLLVITRVAKYIYNISSTQTKHFLRSRMPYCDLFHVQQDYNLQKALYI